jgi:hypothetical protein
MILRFTAINGSSCGKAGIDIRALPWPAPKLYSQGTWECLQKKWTRPSGLTHPRRARAGISVVLQVKPKREVINGLLEKVILLITQIRECVNLEIPMDKLFSKGPFEATEGPVLTDLSFGG